MTRFHPLDFIRRPIRLKAWSRAPERRPRWRVAATVREPVEVVAAFACHHLAAGAERVTIYFDDPDDPAIDIVGGLDRVEVVRCDAAHWQRLAGARPATHYLRQIANVSDAARAPGDEWLFHVDADEFLHMPDGIAPDLATLGRRTRWLRVPVAERIWDGPVDSGDLFGGIFRRPLAGGPAEVERIYGGVQTHLNRSGLAGHDLGKALMRTDRPVAPKVHGVMHSKNGRLLPNRTANGMTLLHFDGLSRAHWALKHFRQIGRLLSGDTVYRGARRTVTVDILNADDPLARAFGWYDRTYRLQPQTLARLRASGHVLAVEPGIVETAREMLPGVTLEFTQQALDRQLSDRIEAALAELHAARRTTTFA